MLGSLRFRLPALFSCSASCLPGSSLPDSIRFFQSYIAPRGRRAPLESVGIVQLYARQAGRESVAPAASFERSAATHLWGRRSRVDACSRHPDLEKNVLSIGQIVRPLRRRRRDQLAGRRI